MNAAPLLLVVAALTLPAVPAAAPIGFAAEFLGTFEHVLFTGRVVPEWRWWWDGFGGGEPVGPSWAHGSSAHSLTAMEGACTALPDAQLTWSVEEQPWRGEHVGFRLTGTLCPGIEPAPGIAGRGALEVTGGTGRFAGATGAGTWAFTGQAQEPFVYLHDLTWNYVGVAGEARLGIEGELHLP